MVVSWHRCACHCFSGAGTVCPAEAQIGGGAFAGRIVIGGHGGSRRDGHGRRYGYQSIANGRDP